MYTEKNAGYFNILITVFRLYLYFLRGPSWPWSYGSWIYNWL